MSRDLRNIVIGIVLLMGVVGVGISRLNRWRISRTHSTFLVRFNSFEQEEANTVWRCLLGTDNIAREILPPQQFALAAYAGRHFECADFASKASKKIKDLDAPPEYNKLIDVYSEVFSNLFNALISLKEKEPKHSERNSREQEILSTGAEWSRGVPAEHQDKKKPMTTSANLFELFLRCSVPTIQQMTDKDDVVIYFLSRCRQDAEKNWSLDDAFLANLQTCIIQEHLPSERSKGLSLAYLAPSFDRLSSALESCFQAIERSSISKEIGVFSRAWADSASAASKIQKLAASYRMPK